MQTHAELLAYARRYHHKNREKRKAYNRQWYRKNKERAKLSRRQRYESNKEHSRLYAKRWRHENKAALEVTKDGRNEYHREWYERNKYREREKQRERRNRHRRQTPSTNSITRARQIMNTINRYTSGQLSYEELKNEQARFEEAAGSE